MKAHITRFLITFGFLLFGLFVWAMLPNTIGISAAILLGFVGALLGAVMMKKASLKKEE